MSKAKAVLFRFFTMFLSGGVSSALILFSNPTQFSNLTDVKKIATSIIIAFLVGGISAVEKSLVDLQTTTQTVITSTAVGSNSAPQATVITSTTNVPDNVSVTSVPSTTPPQ